MKFITAATIPVAVLVAGALVWQGSNAAFSSSTRNSGNGWSTGSVALTDDDNGVAGFTVKNLMPMQTGTRCIKVTASSSNPGVVKSYVANLNESAQGLEDRITLDVQSGSGGGFGDCAGFVDDGSNTAPAMSLSTLADVNHDFATGGAGWTTTGSATGESKTYKFTYKFDTTGMTQPQIDALQGAAVSIDCVWELQNN